jgi:GNAT superfamily N-acetyltransferase
MNPTFRPLSRSELDTVLAWAEAEGWNPGRQDAEAFWAADPDGFYGLELDGDLIGSGSIVSYGGKLGFVGLFIVRPEWRGKGHGSYLWKRLIERLHERLEPGAAAALDGVFAMQSYYAKSGFVFSHRNLRMEGIGKPGPRAPELVEMDALPFEQVVEFDRTHFIGHRPEFLKRWIHPEGGLALGHIRDGKLAGCGVVRPCSRGFKIGPLIAEDPQIAEALFVALSDQIAGEPLFLDTPENNPEAIALAKRHGLTECFGCARMVMGRAPEVPWQMVYGVTTFELG